MYQITELYQSVWMSMLNEEKQICSINVEMSISLVLDVIKSAK